MLVKAKFIARIFPVKKEVLLGIQCSYCNPVLVTLLLIWSYRGNTYFQKILFIKLRALIGHFDVNKNFNANKHFNNKKNNNCTKMVEMPG